MGGRGWYEVIKEGSTGSGSGVEKRSPSGVVVLVVVGGMGEDCSVLLWCCCDEEGRSEVDVVVCWCSAYATEHAASDKRCSGA